MIIRAYNVELATQVGVEGAVIMNYFNYLSSGTSDEKVLVSITSLTNTFFEMKKSKIIKVLGKLVDNNLITIDEYEDYILLSVVN